MIKKVTYLWIGEAIMKIEISTESIPKSSYIIDSMVFSRLRKLFTEIDWLGDLEESFLDIWNLCTKSQQQDLIEDLIRRFSYMTSRDLKREGESIAKQLTTVWDINPLKTLVIAFADSDKPDGSQALLQSIKDKFVLTDNWSENNFINRIVAGANKIKSGETAVLIDDFTGTGNTAKRRINWFTNKLNERNIKGCKIFFVTLAMMEAAKPILSLLPIEDYFSCLCLRRAISDEYTGDVLTRKKQSMVELEELLAETFKGRKLTNYNFGYQRSEALYSLEAYNTPNNVFPIFWWPELRSGKRRRPMFNHFIG